MRRSLALLALLCALLAGCGGQNAPSVTLNVFAAASLTGAFGELGTAFEKQHAGTRVVLNLAGSQQLAQQITQGAPADVFASANQKQMDIAIQSGRITASASQVFAQNRLALVFPSANSARITSLADLARPGLKLVLADKSVPAGQYALDFLDKASADPAFGPMFKARVLANVVSTEQDVKAVLTRITLGGADAGIVYQSDITGSVGSQVSHIEIPAALQVTARYPIAPLADSQHADLTRAFVAFVLSSQGQTTLRSYGFIPITG